MPQLQSKAFRHNNKREEVVPERITDGKHNYVSSRSSWSGSGSGSGSQLTLCSLLIVGTFSYIIVCTCDLTQQIGAEIGRGGFAVVFQAFNVELGDFNAVKRFPLHAIDDESLSQIEVGAQARLVTNILSSFNPKLYYLSLLLYFRLKSS
jgi:hypothetical protein